DEQQRIRSRLIAEILGHRQGRQSDTQTGSRRLVHLAKDHRRLLDNLAARLADFGFLHFDPQVGSFTRALADAGKHRRTAVSTGDTSDELLQNNRLAKTSTTEQSSLTTADERREQVDDLDARLEDFR